MILQLDSQTKSPKEPYLAREPYRFPTPAIYSLQHTRFFQQKLTQKSDAENRIFRPHDSLTWKDMSSRFLQQNLTSQTCPRRPKYNNLSFSTSIKCFTLSAWKQASLVWR